MTIIDYRASARVALRALENDNTFTHKTAQLRQWFPETIIDEINRAEQDARTFNADAAKAGGAMLSPEAGAYWAEVELLLKRGAAAKDAGDELAITRVSKQSERLEETFEERVPAVDKPKFVQFDAQKPDLWDHRWDAVDFRPALLRQDLMSAHRIEQPRNHAQRTVLSMLGQPEISDEDAAQMREQGRKLRMIALDRRAVLTMREAQATNKFFKSKSDQVEKKREKARRYLAAQARKAEIQAEIAAGLRYANGAKKKRKKSV